ncbi:MAG TPA: membrane protein insertase YidC [Bryobacteraceae bacterium]|nr:membrane protein insertase YidC [Bryobacteraceae bacterium]
MDKKELTMETRLLLAFVLVGIVLVGWNYIYKPPPPPVTPASTAPAQTTQPAAETPKDAPAPVPSQNQAEVAENPGQVQAAQVEEFDIETDLYKVRFSNQGAVVQHWILKKYKDGKGKPLDLVNTRALAKVTAPFAVAFRNQAPHGDPNKGLFQMERSADQLGVTFEYSDGRTSAKKTFQFMPNSYLVQITSQVADSGVLVPHELTWRGGFGDQTLPAAATVEDSLYYDETNSKLVKNELKIADKGPVTTSGQYTFAGIEDKYFAAAVLPAAGGGLGLTTYSDSVPGLSGADEKRIGVGAGGSGLNSFKVFIGPKDADTLRSVDPRLDTLIDWGRWFGFIAKPLFLGLTWTAKHLAANNFGWAIVLVTFAINMVLFPLRFSSMRSAKKMQALQPQIKALNDKYKDLPLRDPRKQEQQAEMMELYKKHGVNPVGGCVPMLLQLPFLIAFYTVLGVAIEMRGANWLWISDLSQPEAGFFAALGPPIRLLPLLLIVTQFLQQKMTPSPGMDPAQQKMMLFMPLVLGFMFYGQSSGLVLYWLTGGLVGIAQQWLLSRGGTPQAVAVSIPPVKKKK